MDLISTSDAQAITGSFLDSINLTRVILTVIVIIAAWVLRVFAKRILERWCKKHPDQVNQFSRSTVASVTVRTINALYVIIVACFILSLYGVNVRGLATSIGIVGAVIGFAMQDFLKDIIMGVRILTEHIFQVGDIVEYNGVRARVVDFGLKSTELYLLPNDGTLFLANRNISEVTRFDPKDFQAYLDIPFSYRDDPEEVKKLITGLLPEINALAGVSGAEYGGISDFEPLRAMYRVNFHCPPAEEKSLTRRVNTMVYTAARKNGFSVPNDRMAASEKAV